MPRYCRYAPNYRELDSEIGNSRYPAFVCVKLQSIGENLSGELLHFATVRVQERLRLTCSCTGRRARQRRARRESLGAKYTGMRYKVHARASTVHVPHTEGTSPIASPPVFELSVSKGVLSWKRRGFGSHNSFPRAVSSPS